jgi:hypothetical protein
MIGSLPLRGCPPVRQVSRSPTVGIYYASGQAYSPTVKVVNEAAMVVLKEAGKLVLHSRWWTMQVVKKVGKHGATFIPDLRLTKEFTSPAIRGLVSEILPKK